MEEVMYVFEVVLKKGNEIREKVLKVVGRV